MCMVSNLGYGYGETFPKRWPQIPFVPPQPVVPDVPEWQKPHEFEPVQDDLRHCVICDETRDHERHAFHEMLRKARSRDNRQVIPISVEDFEALKAEVEALKELLKAAKIYDEATGQTDCESPDKVAFLRMVAEFVGVDLEEIFGGK